MVVHAPQIQLTTYNKKTTYIIKTTTYNKIMKVVFIITFYDFLI